MEMANWDWLSMIVIMVLLIAVGSGIQQGWTGSVRDLVGMLVAGIVTVTCIYVAWQVAGLCSPPVQDWMQTLQVRAPQFEGDWWQQAWAYTLLALRDFDMLRFGLLFLLTYFVIVIPVERTARAIVRLLVPSMSESPTPALPSAEVDDKTDVETDDEMDKSSPAIPRWLNALAGSAVGVVIGAWRSLLILVAVYLLLVMLPQAPYAASLQQSTAYKMIVERWIEPFGGDFIQNKVPVWTDKLEQQFQQIISQKYAILDAQIPNDISAAAQTITVRAKSDEERARALYQWIGSRIVYDWNKVKMYEEQNIWLEQTPDDTFRSRKGVCIDYARLYAVMARTVGLDVKIVTGLGYDGRGGYGPHAWNEVKIGPDRWVPLDATWYSSGRDWFNPVDFYETHVRSEQI